MKSKALFALFGCLISVLSLGQTDINDILKQVEQNNKELKGLNNYLQARKLEIKSQNNLPDPQLIGYYLPFGEHTGDDYSEYEISQSFEFPGVYSSRNKLAEQLGDQLEADWQIKRQEILAEVKRLGHALIYLEKQLAIEKERLTKSEALFKQTERLFEKEEINILELNKSKIAWLQEKFKLNELEGNRTNLLLSLKNFNGGEPIRYDSLITNESLNLTSFEMLWEEKQAEDPKLLRIKQQEEVASSQFQLTKSKSLPNFTLGFNSQGISGERYSGLYGGLSIPLWNNKNKVKAAQANVIYWENQTETLTLAAKAEFESQYNKYQVLHTELQEYRSTLSGINSEELLLKAYELGDISFTTYYSELHFYRQAVDAMLKAESQLYELQIELLKHQL